MSFSCYRHGWEHGQSVCPACDHYDIGMSQIKIDQQSAALQIAIEMNVKLHAENQKLKDAMVVDENGNEYVIVCMMKEKVKEIEAQLAEAKQIIEWYAAESTYWGDPDWKDECGFPIDADEGKKARAFLEKV